MPGGEQTCNTHFTFYPYLFVGDACPGGKADAVMCSSSFTPLERSIYL